MSEAEKMELCEESMLQAMSEAVNRIPSLGPFDWMKAVRSEDEGRLMLLDFLEELMAFADFEGSKPDGGVWARCRVDGWGLLQSMEREGGEVQAGELLGVVGILRTAADLLEARALVL